MVLSLREPSVVPKSLHGTWSLWPTETEPSASPHEKHPAQQVKVQWLPQVLDCGTEVGGVKPQGCLICQINH